MKTFSDLLATDFMLDIVVNGVATTGGLHDDLKFDANDTVIIDGIEILPRYQYLSQNNILSIKGPFYSWLHEVSGQGWLLKPYLAMTK